MRKKKARVFFRHLFNLVLGGQKAAQKNGKGFKLKINRPVEEPNVPIFLGGLSPGRLSPEKWLYFFGKIATAREEKLGFMFLFYSVKNYFLGFVTVT